MSEAKEETSKADKETCVEIAAEAAATTSTTEGVTKSKSQLKRERKEAARHEYWKAVRARKREHYREAKRQRVAEARARGDTEWVDKRRKKNGFWRAVDANHVPPLATVVLDLEFGDRMHDKERRSAVNQLGYCYSANGTDYSSHAALSAATAAPPCACAQQPEVEPHVPRRCAQCLPGYLELVVTSFAGTIRDDTLRVGGSQNWRHVAWDERHYTEVFADKQREGKLVYLTSEAADALEEVEPDTVYVIGGIVDHNRMKGLTHADATARGVRTARLPLEETIAMDSRKVLTINHCCEILLAFANIRALQRRKAAAGEQPLTPHQCWARAVTAVLPARKGARSKLDSDNEEDEEDKEQQKDGEKSGHESEAATTAETAEAAGEARQDALEKKDEDRA